MEKKSIFRNVAVAALGVPLAASLLIWSHIPAPPLAAQSEVPAALDKSSFEVSSVKPNHSADNRISIRFTAGRFVAEGVTTKFLIEYAYQIKDEQLSGGPSWITANRYDIDAKLDDALTKEIQTLPPVQRVKPNRLALQFLLADRFRLKVSQQSKEGAIFALVVAKSGPKVAPTTVSPSELYVAGNTGLPKGPIMKLGLGQLAATAVPMNLFIEALAQQPEIGGRVIVDKTGLTGNYDFMLQWAPDQRQSPGEPPPDNISAADSSRPSFFTALEEQLGLRLEATKGPVSVLVIDQIEQPSPN